MLTFHASDANGSPVRDLRSNEIRLWDNGAPPRRIVAFDSLFDRPIRAGILIDTSDSVEHVLESNKIIAEKSVEELFRPKSDEVFAINFGLASETAQQWTDEPKLLVQSISNMRPGKLKGTAIFDALFRACFYGFDKVDPTTTANFILLFSDGEDNAGQANLKDALSACQQRNVAIFAFCFPANHESTGPKTLRELASNTGGRVFLGDESEESIGNDLKTIESEMRNQYRLVYNPAGFSHDGAFHQIELQPPDRVRKIEVRSGYYAPFR